MKKIFTIVGVVAVVSVNAQIVISEVYGGGGNTGATYTHDFVELVNRGTSDVTLSTPYLQYASANGNVTSSNILALPSITLKPGQYYLIQLAKGNGGTTALPAPDFIATGTGALALGATGGKIALTSDGNIVTSTSDRNLVDFVGWGAANQSEGSPAPATTNTTSITRTKGLDTNNNAADFTVGAPTPQNTSNFLSTMEANSHKHTLVQNSIVERTIVFGAKSDVKIFSTTGQLIKSATVNDGSALDVSSLAKGVYIVTGEVDGTKVSQKIIKK